MIINKNNFIVRFSYFLLTLLIINQLHAQEKFDDNFEIINVVISSDIIVDINGTYAQAAIDFAMNNIISTGYENVQQIKPEIVNSFEEIQDRIKENKADIIGISIFDYVKYYDELNITPIFIVQLGPNPGTEYIVLINSDRKIKSLSDLSSKNILTYLNKEGELASYWLFNEMKKENINDPYAIINTFTKIEQSRKRVFSVFFGKADGCIISKEQFDSLSELNPQLKKKLKVLYESPSFVTNVYCSNDNSAKEGVGIANDFVKNINKTNSGSEMIKLFKSIKFVSFEEDFIETTQKLYDEYKSYIKE
jgi:ABC-type phosphate/phosphonate transport system substrate-binding protein